MLNLYNNNPIKSQKFIRTLWILSTFVIISLFVLYIAIKKIDQTHIKFLEKVLNLPCPTIEIFDSSLFFSQFKYFTKEQLELKAQENYDKYKEYKNLLLLWKNFLIKHNIKKQKSLIKTVDFILKRLNIPKNSSKIVKQIVFLYHIGFIPKKKNNIYFNFFSKLLKNKMEEPGTAPGSK